MTYIDKFMSKQAFEEALFMLGFIEKDDQVFRVGRSNGIPLVKLVSPHDLTVFNTLLKWGSEPIKDFFLTGYIILNTFKFRTVKIFTHSSTACQEDNKKHYSI